MIVRLFFALAVLGLTAVPAAAAAPKRKVIIDQDAFGPGGSNMQALLLAIQSPDVEVLGITIESGDGWCAENVAHTLRLLEIIGRTDIPVVAGSTWPLVNTPEATKRWEARYGKLSYKGAWTEVWPKETPVKRGAFHAAEVVPPLVEGAPSTRAAPEPAAVFLTRKVREFPGEVSILALGPLTNLALALRLDDAMAGNVRELVVMGGSFSPQPANNAFALEYVYTPRLEFNFRWDPEAASAVFHAPWKSFTLVPVDPTTKTFFSPELIKRSTAVDTPLARYIAHYAESFPMWDELASAVWLRPEIVTRRETLAVDVDHGEGAGYGNTLSWAKGQGPGLGERDVTVVFEVDVPALEQLTAEAFTRPSVSRK
jgi:purine nucleosidase